MGRQKRIEFAAPDKRVVAKANDLIRARHSFSTIEQRIFVMMIARLDRDTEEFPIQEIRLQTVCDLADIPDSNLYGRVDEITSNLLDRKVEVRAEDSEGHEQEFLKYNCYSLCRHKRGSGVIKAKFNDDMRDFLLQLKEKFTLYLVKVFLRLESKYSTQIYELLKMRQDLRHIRLSVEEFRHSLGLEDKYNRFSSLRKRVLEQARKELREKADVYYTYEVERDGQTPAAINFYIQENEEVIQNLQEELAESKSPQLQRTRQSEDGEVSETPPRMDPRDLFRAGLEQKQLNTVDEDTIEHLFEEAKKQINGQNPEMNSMRRALEIRERMTSIWEGG